jgi:uncharacterized RDD family membrane protein YckC
MSSRRSKNRASRGERHESDARRPVDASTPLPLRGNGRLQPKPRSMPRPDVDTLLRVETPENVEIEYELAGPAARMAAYVIDLLVRIGLFLALSMITGWILDATELGESALQDIVNGILLVGVFVLEWGYPTLFEAYRRGRTPGKSSVGLRVIRTNGTPISFADAAIRNLLRAVDALPLPYGCGLVSMLISPRFQRLGDLAAGTVVIWDRRVRSTPKRRETKRSAPRLGPGETTTGYRPADRTLVLIDRLEQRLDVLHPARAEEIARPLATVLARRLGISPGHEGGSSGTPNVELLLRIRTTFASAAGGSVSDIDERDKQPARRRYAAVPAESRG